MSQREDLARAFGIELPEMRVARERHAGDLQAKAKRRKRSKVAARSRARNR